MQVLILKIILLMHLCHKLVPHTQIVFFSNEFRWNLAQMRI